MKLRSITMCIILTLLSVPAFAAGTVTGTVKGVSFQPLPGTTVLLEPLPGISVQFYDTITGNAIAKTGITDTSGNYSVTGIAAGSYKVVFFGNNVASAPFVQKWYSGAANFTSATAITVSDNATTSGINVSLSTFANPIIDLGTISNAAAGTVVKIPVSITTNGVAISSVGLHLTYDQTKIDSVTSYDPTDTAHTPALGLAASTAAKTIFDNMPVPGSYVIGLLSTNNTNVIGDGVLVNLYFKLTPGATGQVLITSTPSAADPSAANVTITGASGSIALSGISAPSVSTPIIVTNFTVPATATTLIVPITTFTASGNTVTGYLLTESATPPAITATGWSTTIPGTYSFSTAGAKTLYAWVKDTAGNVSASRSANVTIILPDPSLTFSALTLSDGTSTKNPAFNIAGTVRGNEIAIKTLTIAQNSGVPIVVPFDAASGGSFNTALVLATGANTIVTVATDVNNHQTTDTRIITLNPGLIDLLVTVPANNSFIKDPFIILTGTVGSPQSAVTYSLNGGPAVPITLYGDNFSTSIYLNSGPNTIIVKAIDSITGGVHTQALGITSDGSGPNLSVFSPISAFATPKSSVVLSGNITNAVASSMVSISVDGIAISTQPVIANDGCFSATITLPTVKTYTVVVTATDQAQNSSSVARNVIRTYPSGNLSDGVSTPTLSDALIVMRYALGLVTPSADQILNADVAPLINGKPAPDGMIDGGDALVILERVVGSVSW